MNGVFEGSTVSVRQHLAFSETLHLYQRGSVILMQVFISSIVQM